MSVVVDIHVEGTEEFASNPGLIRDQPSKSFGINSAFWIRRYCEETKSWEIFISITIQENELLVFVVNLFMRSGPQNWEYCLSHRNEEENLPLWFPITQG